ncbi:MAG TPA: DUF2844 domain-containing protein [Asticcacaulis sp.]|nr:DUF2844 domain-containing protein [Asticcacaulis sp.]
MRPLYSAIAAAVFVALAHNAHAELGQPASSVDLDQRRLAPRIMSVHAVGAANRHDMALGNGGAVREFTNADGTVFAVSWTGPRRPDLRQLFGSVYFQRFQADNVQTGHIRMRRALASTHADFVVRTGGVSSAQWGYAILPQATPNGFDMRQLTATDGQP